MTPFVLRLEQSSDRFLIGGKSAGLSRLAAAGFRVPPGLCITTVAYDQAMQAAGLDAEVEWKRVYAAEGPERAELLARIRKSLTDSGLPRPIAEALKDDVVALRRSAVAILGEEFTHWAVRSSAALEDTERGSYGGLYHTVLGVSWDQLPEAIVACWASLWSEEAATYAEPFGHTIPTMAVLIQPLLTPVSSGVAYSSDPILGDPAKVVINAVFGLGEPLVAGRVIPDQYTVADGILVASDINDKAERLVSSSDSSGLRTEPVPLEERSRAALRPDEVMELAGLVRRIETFFGHAIDLEWASCDGFWILQARPIAARGSRRGARPAFTWSRANFLETLPELPSPLALAFVDRFMETNIIDHYRRLGCHVPAGVSSVRCIKGRPYINMTLLQSLTAQLGGDPSSISEHMGGEPTPRRHDSSLVMSPLPGLQLFRALCLLQIQVVRAGLTSPRWFTRLRRVAEAQWEPALDDLSEEQLIDRMSHINRRLEAGDLTFAIVSGVSQAFYILNATLRRRLTAWRATLNAATQGLGTIISAKQIFWLQELAETAAQDPAVCRFMTEEPWHPEQFRAALAGSRFLDEFEAWLEEYGHRAVGESDVMSPRFAERPEYLLAIIRRHLLDQPLGPVRSVATIEREQAATRTRALRDIRRAFGFRVHEWFWFRVWYRILCRFLAFRESNRHALMRYLAAVRHLLQALGQKLSARGLLSSPDDLFYLTDDEIRMLVAGAATTGEPSWHALVRHRQQERAHYASLSAPHTVSERISAVSTVDTAQEVSEVACLLGLPVSSGVSEGPVRLILTPSDIGRTRHGEILVAPALDPGMAPAFGVAAGLIVELGGLLSHGAIIAREYGIPAVTNVPAATRRLKNGEWVRLDADRGEVRRAEGKPERSQSRW